MVISDASSKAHVPGNAPGAVAVVCEHCFDRGAVKDRAIKADCRLAACLGHAGHHFVEAYWVWCEWFEIAAV